MKCPAIPEPEASAGGMFWIFVVRPARGIVARFLFVLPVSLAGYRDDDAPPIPEHVTRNYTAEIEGLALATADFDRPAVLALTDAARVTRSAFAREIEVQLRRGAELHDMRDWANKLSGTTVRLAALLHLAHYPTTDGAGPWTSGRWPTPCGSCGSSSTTTAPRPTPSPPTRPAATPPTPWAC